MDSTIQLFLALKVYNYDESSLINVYAQKHDPYYKHNYYVLSNFIYSI